jgi:hypothetical protein
MPRKSCRVDSPLVTTSRDSSPRGEGVNATLGTHRAMQMKVDWSATCMPGQTRRPNPKGRTKSAPTLPLQFPAGFCGVRKREGSNVSGSSNSFGSLTSTLRGRNVSWTRNLIERRGCNILNITDHGSAFGDIIPLIDIILACCMWYAERNHRAPSFMWNHHPRCQRGA